MPFVPWVAASTAPSGPAGGGLNGTYPNPGIAVPVDLQGTVLANPVFGSGFTGDANNRTEIRANGTVAFGTGAVAPDTLIFRSIGPVLTVSRSLDLNTVGTGVQVAEGTNAKQGTATLVAGTVTVANTSVTANSRIFLTAQSLGGTQGILAVTARTAGTSFTITSSNAADTSVVAYEIFEPG